LLFEWTDAVRSIISRSTNLQRDIPSIYLFSTRDGGGCCISGFDSVWQRIVEKSGIKNVHFHDIRAKAAADAKEAGQDYQNLLGHTSQQMAEK